MNQEQRNWIPEPVRRIYENIRDRFQSLANRLANIPTEVKQDPDYGILPEMSPKVIQPIRTAVRLAELPAPEDQTEIVQYRGLDRTPDLSTDDELDIPTYIRNISSPIEGVPMADNTEGPRTRPEPAEKAIAAAKLNENPDLISPPANIQPKQNHWYETPPEPDLDEVGKQRDHYQALLDSRDEKRRPKLKTEAILDGENRAKAPNNHQIQPQTKDTHNQQEVTPPEQTTTQDIETIMELLNQGEAPIEETPEVKAKRQEVLLLAANQDRTSFQKAVGRALSTASPGSIVELGDQIKEAYWILQEEDRTQKELKNPNQAADIFLNEFPATTELIKSRIGSIIEAAPSNDLLAIDSANRLRDTLAAFAILTDIDPQSKLSSEDISLLETYKGQSNFYIEDGIIVLEEGTLTSNHLVNLINRKSPEEAQKALAETVVTNAIISAAKLGPQNAIPLLLTKEDIRKYTGKELDVIAQQLGFAVRYEEKNESGEIDITNCLPSEIPEPSLNDPRITTQEALFIFDLDPYHKKLTAIDERNPVTLIATLGRLNPAARQKAIESILLDPNQDLIPKEVIRYIETRRKAEPETQPIFDFTEEVNVLHERKDTEKKRAQELFMQALLVKEALERAPDGDISIEEIQYDLAFKALEFITNPQGKEINVANVTKDALFLDSLANVYDIPKDTINLTENAIGLRKQAIQSLPEGIDETQLADLAEAITKENYWQTAYTAAREAELDTEQLFARILTIEGIDSKSSMAKKFKLVLEIPGIYLTDQLPENPLEFIQRKLPNGETVVLTYPEVMLIRNWRETLGERIDQDYWDQAEMMASIRESEGVSDLTDYSQNIPITIRTVELLELARQIGATYERNTLMKSPGYRHIAIQRMMQLSDTILNPAEQKRLNDLIALDLSQLPEGNSDAQILGILAANEQVPIQVLRQELLATSAYENQTKAYDEDGNLQSPYLLSKTLQEGHLLEVTKQLRQMESYQGNDTFQTRVESIENEFLGPKQSIEIVLEREEVVNGLTEKKIKKYDISLTSPTATLLDFGTKDPDTKLALLDEMLKRQEYLRHVPQDILESLTRVNDDIPVALKTGMQEATERLIDILDKSRTGYMNGQLSASTNLAIALNRLKAISTEPQKTLEIMLFTANADFSQAPQYKEVFKLLQTDQQLREGIEDLRIAASAEILQGEIDEIIDLPRDIAPHIWTDVPKHMQPTLFEQARIAHDWRGIVSDSETHTRQKREILIDLEFEPYILESLNIGYSKGENGQIQITNLDDIKRWEQAKTSLMMTGLIHRDARLPETPKELIETYRLNANDVGILMQTRTDLRFDYLAQALELAIKEEDLNHHVAFRNLDRNTQMESQTDIPPRKLEYLMTIADEIIQLNEPIHGYSQEVYPYLAELLIQRAQAIDPNIVLSQTDRNRIMRLISKVEGETSMYDKLSKASKEREEVPVATLLNMIIRSQDRYSDFTRADIIEEIKIAARDAKTGRTDIAQAKQLARELEQKNPGHPDVQGIQEQITILSYAEMTPEEEAQEINRLLNLIAFGNRSETQEQRTANALYSLNLLQQTRYRELPTDVQNAINTSVFINEPQLALNNIIQAVNSIEEINPALIQLMLNNVNQLNTSAMSTTRRRQALDRTNNAIEMLRRRVNQQGDRRNVARAA